MRKGRRIQDNIVKLMQLYVFMEETNRQRSPCTVLGPQQRHTESHSRQRE